MYHAGQKFVPSASRENEIDRLLRDARAGRLSYTANDREPMSLGHALAKNTTGADLAVGKPALYNYTFTHKAGPAFARKDWDPRKGYYTLIPRNPLRDGDTVGGVALTLEPIKQNEFGLVAVSGLALWIDEPAGGISVGMYICPGSTQFGVADYGLGRVVQGHDSGAIVDLSEVQLMAPYALASSWSAPPNPTATATIGGLFGSLSGHTTTLRDGYNSGAWVYQTPYNPSAPFQGIARYVRGTVVGSADVGAWHVVIPYC
jgi:hypothetical protein